MHVKEKIGVLCFCLNEVLALQVIAPRLREILSKQNWDSELIFVDGNSTDGSYDFLTDQSFYFVRQKEPGIPQALIDGFAEVKKLSCTHVVIFQPDGNCDPEKLPELVSVLLTEATDIVIGSRYFATKKSPDDSVITAFGNWTFNKLYRFKFSNSKLTDVLVGYRGLRIELVDELDILETSEYKWLERTLRCTFSFDTLMLIRAIRSNATIREIDAPECLRIGGVSKRATIQWGIAYLCQLLFDNQIRKISGKTPF